MGRFVAPPAYVLPDSEKCTDFAGLEGLFGIWVVGIGFARGEGILVTAAGAFLFLKVVGRILLSFRANGLGGETSYLNYSIIYLKFFFASTGFFLTFLISAG